MTTQESRLRGDRNEGREKIKNFIFFYVNTNQELPGVSGAMAPSIGVLYEAERGGEDDGKLSFGRLYSNHS